MVVFIGGGLRLEFVEATTNANSNSIVVPASVVAGDLLVLADSGTRNLSDVGNVTPTGFTQFLTEQGIFSLTRYRMSASYKIAESGDASATLDGIGTGDVNVSNERKILLVFRGNKPITAVAVHDPVDEAAQGAPSAQALSADTGTHPLISFGFYYTSAATALIDPRTFTIGGNDAKDAEEDSETGAASIWAAWKIMNGPASLAEVSVSMQDEGDMNILGSACLECSAA